ncbi:MAG: TIGR00341 family protein [Planctomycetota bacterium]|nr:TIGR00341 family protein [Planctomycetota bacterium]MDA0932968.1 TIGR00341 family protein [Planctomycetota bacterium]
MPLRLIEVLLPSDAVASFDASSLPDGVVAVWPGGEAISGVAAIRVLVPKALVEPVLDQLQGRYGHMPAFRVVLLDVGLTLPPVAEPEAAPEPEEPKPERRFGRVSRQELLSDLRAAIEPRFEFVPLVFLSAVVAATGLLRDNAAVVIAAMVIAPLLGPNMALALGATTGDEDLIRTALRRNLEGVALAGVLAVLIGVAVRGFADPDALLASVEIRSRTEGIHPGDFLLALASGVAGTLSFTSGAPTTTIGVMVAVALMPPLVCAGLLLGCGRIEPAIAASLLLVTNVACVNLAAVATFSFLGVRPARWWEAERARKATRIAVWISAATLAGLAVVTAVRLVRTGT